jgi:hypothetical protein
MMKPKHGWCTPRPPWAVYTRCGKHYKAMQQTHGPVPPGRGCSRPASLETQAQHRPTITPYHVLLSHGADSKILQFPTATQAMATKSPCLR